MQVSDPPWKIRTRPCPFYSQGKCLFSRNCSFLHQVKSTPTVIRVTGPEDDYVDIPDSNKTVPAKLPMSTPEAVSDEPWPPPDNYVGSHFDEYDDSQGEDDVSDVESPTIRHHVLPPITTKRDSVSIDTGPSRDSVATVKGGSYGSGMTSHSSLPLYKSNAHHPRGRSTIASLSSFSTPPRNDSGEIIPLLSPFSESPSLAKSPSSATSANAQEIEIRNLSGPVRSTVPFSLASASSSSLLTNRIAKLQGRNLSIPPSFVGPSSTDSVSPFSAGELYASYQQEDTVGAPTSPRFADASTDVTAPNPVSPTPHTVPKTPTWLRPLRLASALTPQSGNQSAVSSTGYLQQFFEEPESGPSASISNSSNVSVDSLYNSPVVRKEPNELYRMSSSPSHNIPTDTPHTIVLSEPEGYVSPLALSRNPSLDIDMSQYPPPLDSSPDGSIRDISSSPSSISLSELTGVVSPRTRPPVISIRTVNLNPAADPSPPIQTSRTIGRATTPAEQLRSALERRANRIRASSQLLASPDMRNITSDHMRSTSDSQTLVADITVPTTLSHGRSMSATPAFTRSQSDSSWILPHINSLPVTDIQPSTSTSDSLLLQAQSSPPRVSPRSRLKPSPGSTTSPLSQSTHSPSPSLDPSPRPHLLFAIASDQPAEVERLLSNGEASVNETTGAGEGLLEFTVANEGLKNKTEIVKTLLKYGADPGPLNDNTVRDGAGDVGEPHQSPGLAKKVEEGMNPAMKYYLNRPQSLDADSKPALEVLQQSSFAPLARARFDIIGQDRALDEFYRVLGMHSQRKTRNALVILLCGASGHGKSLLAQKVGSLLDVPTHTINMTALRSQHDLWQCLSTGMDDVSPDLDLSEFLVENQGKRCVVVLDEIEKVDDPKSLNPLLLPWDIGRCSLEQKKHTDTSKVIWIATSNLGEKLIFEHVQQWGHPDTPPTRAEYTQLATAVRRRIAEVLGASLLSRVTAILPFLPFTEVEKIAIGTEAALSQGGFASANLSSADIEALVRRAVKDVNFVEEEGARSLYRVVETHLSTTT